MEAVRRSNEYKRPPVPSVPYEELTEIERDIELEDRLIFLTACLEQLMIRILEQKLQRPAAPIQLMAEMVNRAVTLAETLPAATASTVALARAMEAAGRAQPLVRLLPVDKNRLLVEMISGVGQGRLGYLANSAPSLMGICEGLTMVLKSYLLFFETYFYSSVTRDRWRGVYQVLLADLAFAIAEPPPPHFIKRDDES
jgi:hypothetical protein